jgi:opine dehydrogenase
MIGIYGLGNIGFALLAYLNKKFNEKIIIFTNNSKNLDLINIFSIDKMEHILTKNKDFYITTNLEDFLSLTTDIFITSITTYYEEIAIKLANSKNFNPKIHNIILFSSKLGGILVFKKIFNDHNIDDCNIIETDALFAARKIEDNKIWIRNIKRWNLMITSSDYLKSNPNLSIYKKLREYFINDVDLKIADNFVQRGLTDFGVLAHPIISLINLANIDNQKDMLFYYEGITPNTVVLIESLYNEFNSLANKFDTKIIEPQELLYRYYTCDKSNLLTAIKTVTNYKYTKLPNSIFNRFLYEDTLNTLVPAYLLGNKLNLNMNLAFSIINIIGSLFRIDPIKEGRNLEKLGLEKIDIKNNKKIV